MAKTPKPATSPADAVLDSARRSLKLEADALAVLARSVDERFARAVELISGVRGHTIVTGMGKSGHIAHKIAATLASTGTPAFFVHPAEASHGDLGMITKDSGVLAVSNSGDTTELADVIAYTRRHGVPLVAITSRDESRLAQHADVALVIPDAEEACPHGLAPTTSTTMMLALGDALAIALLDRRGFTEADFHARHPGGRLGTLLVRVRDIMHSVEEIPSVAPESLMNEAITKMSKGGFGVTAILDRSDDRSDDRRALLGVITDGDIRRHAGADLPSLRADQVMTRNPRTIRPDALASEALKTMNDRGITALFVTDEDRLAGLIHIHDCLRAGLG
jgi:arabinose-5-phosphate isomerase